MNIRDGFIGMVGNTPLIKLQRPSEEIGCPPRLGSSDEITKWKNLLSSRLRQDDIGN